MTAIVYTRREKKGYLPEIEKNYFTQLDTQKNYYSRKRVNKANFKLNSTNLLLLEFHQKIF